MPDRPGPDRQQTINFDRGRKDRTLEALDRQLQGTLEARELVEDPDGTRERITRVSAGAVVAVLRAIDRLCGKDGTAVAFTDDIRELASGHPSNRTIGRATKWLAVEYLVDVQYRSSQHGRTANLFRPIWGNLEARANGEQLPQSSTPATCANRQHAAANCQTAPANRHFAPANCHPGSAIRNEGGREGSFFSSLENKKQINPSITHSGGGLEGETAIGDTMECEDFDAKIWEPSLTDAQLYRLLAAWFKRNDPNGKLDIDTLVGAVLATRHGEPKTAPQLYCDRCLKSGVKEHWRANAKAFRKREKAKLENIYRGD